MRLRASKLTFSLGVINMTCEWGVCALSVCTCRTKLTGSSYYRMSARRPTSARPSSRQRSSPSEKSSNNHDPQLVMECKAAYLMVLGGVDETLDSKEQLRKGGYTEQGPFSGIILCMRPANERWCYTVTPSLIGWAHTQNDPCHVIEGLWARNWKLVEILFGPFSLWWSNQVTDLHLSSWQLSCHVIIPIKSNLRLGCCPCPIRWGWQNSGIYYL